MRDIDLVMTDVSTTATSLPINSTVTVSTTVKNQAATAATSSGFYVGIYLSTDATITTADTLVGRIKRARLELFFYPRLS